MQNDTDPREQLDDFSAFMQRKLVDHRLPVDDACWREIEARAQSRRLPLRPLMAWVGGVAAVAAVLLVLFLLPLDTVVVQEERRAASVAASQADEDPTPVLVQPLPPVEKALDKDVLADDKPGNNTFIPQIPDGDRPAVPADSANALTLPRDTASRKRASSSEPKRNLYATAPARAPRSHGKWLLAATVGSGGNASLSVGGEDRYAEDAAPPSIPPVVIPPVDPPFMNGAYPLEDYTDVSHSVPISFGITARKYLNKQWALETGLVYTYLSSRYRQGDSWMFESRVKQHYLGIPVNLILNVWDNKRWNIYLSAGGMVEKGLRFILEQNRYANQAVFETKIEEGIRGLQWSLAASAGFSYRMYREWSVYIEPKVSYYFDNHQPASIRTEHSVIFGLNAGLRYEF